MYRFNGYLLMSWEYFVYNFFIMLLSFVRGYIKEVRTVQEQEGSTEDIIIHRRNLRGGYKTENTNTKHTVQVET